MRTNGRYVTGFSSLKSLERANRRPLAAFSLPLVIGSPIAIPQEGSMKRKTFAYGRIVQGVIIWIRREA